MGIIGSPFPLLTQQPGFIRRDLIKRSTPIIGNICYVVFVVLCNIITSCFIYDKVE